MLKCISAAKKETLSIITYLSIVVSFLLNIMLFRSYKALIAQTIFKSCHKKPILQRI